MFASGADFVPLSELIREGNVERARRGLAWVDEHELRGGGAQ